MGIFLYPHCGKLQRWRTYDLRANKDGLMMGYSLQRLLVLRSCCGCKARVMAWKGLDFSQQAIDKRVYPIKRKDHAVWTARIKTDIYEPQHPIVSEATLEMSRDVAKVYKRVIGRAERCKPETAEDARRNRERLEARRLYERVIDRSKL